MNYAEYAALDGVNASTLKELANKSPRHYRYLLANPRTETDAMRFGTAVHTAILEPDKFAAQYVKPPRKMDYRKTEDRTWRDAETIAGHNILDLAEFDRIEAMRDAVMSHTTARDIITGALVETTMQWVDEETGVLCKGRADIIRPDFTILADLKTTRDITPNAFMRSALNLGYALSMAFYVDGIRAVYGRAPETVYLLAVETAAPHDVAPYILDDEWLELGRAQYRDALVKLKACRERDEWPGMVPSEAYLPFPKWAVPDDEKDALDSLEMEDDDNE